MEVEMRYYIAFALLLLSIPGYAETVYFPQVVNGGGYKTTITISNPGLATVTGTLRFYTPGGTAWSLSINSTVNSQFPVSLPGSGSARFITSGTGDIAVGWASLESEGALSGVATYEVRSGGTLTETVGVIGTTAVKKFTVPADHDSHGWVGVALINTGNSPLTVNLSLVDEQGDVSHTSADPDYENIPAHGYVTKFAHQAFPSIPSSYKGTLVGEVDDDGTIAVISLILKDGMQSAIPVTDPSLAVVKRMFGEWEFVFYPPWGSQTRSYSIRAIEDDSSGSGQLYAWGQEYQYHGSILVNWDASRQSYVAIRSDPDWPWSDIYIFNFTSENAISGCWYYQDEYYPDPLNHPIGDCNSLTGTRMTQ